MNYLAHFYLSDDAPAALAGSLMGDFVKGRIEDRFPKPIEHAIRLHRAIDTFTDRDETVLASRRRLDPGFRLLRGILVDVFYDHFLALHWERFSQEPLAGFTSRVYAALEDHQRYFDEPLSFVAPLMASEDWLGSYRELDGIDSILRRMSRRLSRPNSLANGILELTAHYESLERDFFEFLPRLERYTQQLNREFREQSV